MTTTADNNFDKTIKSLKVTGTLHADKLKAGGGWKTFVPTIGNGGVVGTGANLTYNEWRYMIENNTLHVTGQIQQIGATTGGAAGGVYTFTLPPGCTARCPKNDGIGAIPCIGQAFIMSATPDYLFGAVQVDGGGATVSVRVFSDDTAPHFWGGATSAAEFRLGVAGILIVSISYRLELSESCAALAGINP